MRSALLFGFNDSNYVQAGFGRRKRGGAQKNLRPMFRTAPLTSPGLLLQGGPWDNLQCLLCPLHTEVIAIVS